MTYVNKYKSDYRVFNVAFEAIDSVSPNSLLQIRVRSNDEDGKSKLIDDHLTKLNKKGKYKLGSIVRRTDAESYYDRNEHELEVNHG